MSRPAVLTEVEKLYNKRFSDLKHRLRHRFGLTLEEWHAMLEECEYKCEICSRDIKGPWKHSNTKDKACVDHCHETNKIRGVLCVDCNLALGLLRDNLETIKAASQYLQERK